MGDKLKVVKVNILGQDYFIRTTASPSYFKKVAAFINDKTSELIENGLNPETEQLKIAVLACMNITDELFLYKNEKQDILNKIESKSTALLDFIDDKLE
tara:strand:- start:1287 stop:1583 length:297 start_codon:yes stop_codon:yes gene_type:complete